MIWLCKKETAITERLGELLAVAFALQELTPALCLRGQSTWGGGENKCFKPHL